MTPILLSVVCLSAGADEPPAGPPLGDFLCQPAYARDAILRGPIEHYTPRPGDIFLATDQALWSRAGHWLAGAHGFHHSGIVFARSDGRVGLLIAGPFNAIKVEILDPFEHMHKHAAVGDKVWIRRRRVPLTAEESSRLTEFAEAQEGKPFALMRLVAQVTPFRSRGLLRTWIIGRPRGHRKNYFCSELVLECCVAAGLLDPVTTRPSATYPRELFFGTSRIPFLHKHLCLEPCWYPPARWCPSSVVPCGPKTDD